jgi:hypothetical protein
MTEFPTLSYEALTVGEEFVSDPHLVRPEDIEAYAFAVDDHHPWFSGPSPFGGPVAHPTLMANLRRSGRSDGSTSTRGCARGRSTPTRTGRARRASGPRWPRG